MTGLESNSPTLSLVCVLNHQCTGPMETLRDSALSDGHKTWLRINKSTSKHRTEKKPSKMTAKVLGWANGRKMVSVTKIS